jgi:nitrogen fixation NifU-like protein
MLYSDKVLQHFKDPQNQGSLDDATIIGQAGNPVCGDMMKLYLKITPTGDEKNEHIIEDVKFETFGCAAAIANSSILTVMVKGNSIENAMKITKQNIIDELGGLPPVKVHCSMLALEALHKAIDEYLKQS